MPTFSSRGRIDSPPCDLCRATIYFIKERIICTGYTLSGSISRHSVPTLSQHLLLLEAGEKWCFMHMDLQEEGKVIAAAIATGEAIAISDGSFQDQYGTAAWVFEGIDAIGRVTGAVVVPGSAKDQSAYRSELAGIYTIVLFTMKLCDFYQIMTGSVELGCDGQPALDKSFNFVSLI